jgi:hypothetical protein
MANTKMAKLFGIPVDDRDKNKEMDETALDNGNRHFYEDVDVKLMEEDDIDDAHDDELRTVYDKKTYIIAVGKLFSNIGEFSMCFKTYVVKKEFDAKTTWTEKRSFM